MGGVGNELLEAKFHEGYGLEVIEVHDVCLEEHFSVVKEHYTNSMSQIRTMRDNATHSLHLVETRSKSMELIVHLPDEFDCSVA